MERKCHIYDLSSSNGDIRYVGQTISSLSNRKAGHIHKARSKGGNLKSQNWIRKTLNDDSGIRIQLIDIVKESEADYWETYWIAQYKAWGFNLTNIEEGGGCEGSRLGARNGMYKKHHTTKSKKKISETRIKLFAEGKLGTRKGQKNSKEHRSKLSETRRELFKQGRLNTLFANNNPSKGKPARNRRKINKLDLEGNILKTYDCMNDTNKDGYVSANVRKCCQGKFKQYRGFKWEYIN